MLALSKVSLPPFLGLGRMAGPSLRDLLTRGFAKKKADNSLEGMKEAAQRTGNAAKEWLTGASRHAKSAEEKMKQSTEGAYESAKRATSDITNSAKESMSLKAAPQLKSKAAKAAITARKKVEEIGDKAKQAVAGEPQIASARAVWEEGREGSQDQPKRRSRKSQLTDEAHGDNPREAIALGDKQIARTDIDSGK